MAVCIVHSVYFAALSACNLAFQLNPSGAEGWRGCEVGKAESGIIAANIELGGRHSAAATWIGFKGMPRQVLVAAALAAADYQRPKKG